jgi:hypothetical protein
MLLINFETFEIYCLPNPILQCVDGSIQQHSLIFKFMASLTKLAESQNVIILWFATGSMMQVLQ